MEILTCKTWLDRIPRLVWNEVTKFSYNFYHVSRNHQIIPQKSFISTLLCSDYNTHRIWRKRKKRKRWEKEWARWDESKKTNTTTHSNILPLIFFPQCNVKTQLILFNRATSSRTKARLCFFISTFFLFLHRFSTLLAIYASFVMHWQQTILTILWHKNENKLPNKQTIIWGDGEKGIENQC